MSGICGVVSKENCSETLLFATDYHSNLGSQFAGMAVAGGTFKKKIHDISQGQFKSKFSDDYARMTGNKGIGVISDNDAQPLIIHSRFGTYAMAMAGWICKELTATSLQYLRLDDMVSAIGLARENLCTYCWTGKSLEVQNGAIEHAKKLDLL
ncbi:MAG: hypothetical protein HY897_24915 [Deltaproteobacteria bacterium]|nr:hypothetical protein [Deltaproteobacteria bacterium]